MHRTVPFVYLLFIITVFRFKVNRNMKAAPRIFARGAAPPPVRWFICGAGRPDAPARTATRPHLHPPSLVPPFLPHPRPHRTHGATPYDRPDAPLARLSPTPSVSRPAAHPSQGSSVPPADYPAARLVRLHPPHTHPPRPPLRPRPPHTPRCARSSPRAPCCLPSTLTPRPHRPYPHPAAPAPACTHRPLSRRRSSTVSPVPTAHTSSAPARLPTEVLKLQIFSFYQSNSNFDVSLPNLSEKDVKGLLFRK